MIRLLPLNALRVFEAAARLQSFTAAARELGVTISAISHQIKSLEAHLGLDLFERSKNKLKLTAAGRRLLPDVNEGLHRLNEAVSQLRNLRKSAKITIVAAAAFSTKWLAPRLGEFCELYPDIDINVVQSTPWREPTEDEFDIALRYGPSANSAILSERFFSEDVFPVCSPQLMQGERALRTPADLKHHTLLHHPCTLSERENLDWCTWLRMAGIKSVDGSRGPHFNPGTLALESAIAGKGVVLWKSLSATDDLMNGRLVKPFGKIVPLQCVHYLLFPKAVAQKPENLAFRTWLKSKIANSRQLVRSMS